jgi:hypothetical protein
MVHAQQWSIGYADLGVGDHETHPQIGNGLDVMVQAPRHDARSAMRTLGVDGHGHLTSSEMPTPVVAGDATQAKCPPPRGIIGDDQLTQ